MNKITDLPFNVSLLETSLNKLSRIRPTTSMDITEGMTEDLHPDGLYSILTFGEVQSAERHARFSYINLNAKIFHPFIFRQILKVKGWYKDLISGKKYFIWNDTIKDFEPSNEAEGKTGYSFFVKHYTEINFKKTKSASRELRIDLLNKYRNNCMLQYHLVIPAGLRELTIDDNGRKVEDEINDKYRKLIAISRTIQSGAGASESPVYDNARWALQQGAEEIFEILFRMVTGKKGFIQNKYAKRRVIDGTRNVITSLDMSSVKLGDPKQVKVTDTQFGLFETMRGILPLAVFKIRNDWLSKVFSEGEDLAILVDRKTLTPKEVKLSVDNQDRWVSNEGLEQLIMGFSYEKRRHNPIIIDDHYIGLVYRDDKTFKFFNDINELPDDFNKENVHPISWGELYYHALYEEFDDIYSVITRYPVTGLGSTYVSGIYVKTTIAGLTLQPLNNDWQIDEDKKICYEWPDTDVRLPWIDTLSPSSTRLKLLGADFDGDTCSGIFLYSHEARKECRDFLNSKDSLLGPDGKIYHGVIGDLCEWVLWNMSAAEI